MTQTDTKIDQLIINKLTTAQYNEAEANNQINDNELYLITDAYEVTEDMYNDLQTQITGNTTAINSLTTKHNNEISELTTKVNTEITDRGNADTALQEAIEAIEEDITNLEAMDSSLDAKFNQYLSLTGGTINGLTQFKDGEVIIYTDQQENEVQFMAAKFSDHDMVNIHSRDKTLNLESNQFNSGSIELSSTNTSTSDSAEIDINGNDGINIFYKNNQDIKSQIAIKNTISITGDTTVEHATAIDTIGDNAIINKAYLDNKISAINTSIDEKVIAINEINNTQNTNITNLTTRMSTAETNISNNTSAIEDEVEAREAAISSEASARAAAVKTVADNLTGLSTKHSDIKVTLSNDVTGSATIDSGNDIAINATLKEIHTAEASYGLSANASPNHGASFNVPYITVDKAGRIKSASTKTVTLPAATDLSGLEASISGLEAVNNTQNTNITNLTTRMGEAEDAIEDNTQAISDEVTARETAVSDEASARAAAVKTVADNLTGLSTKHNAINVALTSDVTGTGTINSESKISITTTLKNSGVAAGSYGPSADATPADGEQFNVPYITVDAKGRVTAASTKKVTIPSFSTIESDITGLGNRVNTLETKVGDGELTNSSTSTGTATVKPDASTKKATMTAVSSVDTSGWNVADNSTVYTLDMSNFATNTELTAAVTSLSDAMIFRGTLGTSGTITTLPTANASTWGDTYKVITAGTYANQAAKVGDTFTCAKPTGSTTYSWVLIPSGDEPSGTVTNVASGDGLTGGPITSTGTLKANLTSYTKLSNAAADGTETANRVYPVRLDKNGKLAVNVPWVDTDSNTDNTKVTAGNGLTGGGSAVSTTGVTLNVGAGTGISVSADAVSAKLRSTTALTNDSVAASETANRVYPVAVDKSGYLAVNVPWVDTNTDTNTTNVIAGTGLTGGGSAASTTGVTLNVGAGTGIAVAADAVKAKLRSETALTIDSSAATTTSGRVYPVAVDKSGYLAVNVPWVDTDTNTHYASKTIVGNAATDTANEAVTANSIFLNHIENGAVTSSHNIVGSGSTVKSDANGKITITTPTATASTAGLIKVSSVNTTAVSVNSESTNTDRYYPVELNSDGKAIVNVPWTDTNTTYDLSGYSTATNLVNGSAVGSLRGIGTAVNYTIGEYASTLGLGTKASGDYSHAEGSTTTASGQASHTEGCLTTASGGRSHAEGSNTTASGYASHAEGSDSTASGNYSHVEGQGTTASGSSQHVQGKNNITSTSLAHIVGNGASSTSLSNAHTLDWNGNAWFAGNVYIGSTSGTNKDSGSKILATQEHVDNAITAINTTLNTAVQSVSASGTAPLTLSASKSGTSVTITGSVATASGTAPGVTIVYPAASCTTFSSDSGTVTPLAVQKGAKMFSITRPQKKDTAETTTDNAIVRWDGTAGDVQDSKIIIEDVTNTRDTTKTAQVISIPAEGGKKMVYGYCTDQIDGTSFIGGVFDADATEFPYSSGLAIGGTSGNLLWKGNVVATTNQIPSTLKNPNSLTVKGNGTTSFTYDGSAAKSLNIKPGTNVSVSSDTSGNITIAATDTTYSAATTSANGLMTAAMVTKLNGITESADSVSISRSLTSGTKIGSITINGTATDLYCQTNTDTKVTTAANTSSTKSYVTTCSGATTGTLTYHTGVYVNHSTGVLYGAAWNDYAEYREQTEEIEPGYCVVSSNSGKVSKTTEKFQACDGIVSDTYGFAIGETDECKTPLAVAGRVLAYAAGDRTDYQAGDTVAAGPDGKVIKMTREEIREWPDRIVGIVSEIPEYETWGSGNVPVNGRIWIKVK